MKKVLASLKNSVFGDTVDFRIGCWYALSVDAAEKKSLSSSTVAGKSASEELRLPVSLFTKLCGGGRSVYVAKQSCALQSGCQIWKLGQRQLHYGSDAWQRSCGGASI